MAKKTTLLATCLTSTRLATAVCFAFVLPWSDGGNWATWATILLVALIEFSDIFDGMLARRWEQVSEFGKMYDPYADSVSRLIVYWTLAQAGRCFWVVPLVMAVRDVTVSYVRVWGAIRRRDVSARFTGKAKAIIQGLGAGVLTTGPLYWESASNSIITATSIAVLAMTAVSMADYVLAARESAQPEPED
ncbi:MAG: CDP-alcohol phosphatidyltransferase family protein [Planctomycetes bacterium]|nr:CDP-alcohol phosphatidyltransferase family protein [Planctomycetota bacterium]